MKHPTPQLSMPDRLLQSEAALARWEVVARLHQSDLEELDDLITRIQAQAAHVRTLDRMAHIHPIAHQGAVDSLLALLVDLDDDNLKRFKEALA